MKQSFTSTHDLDAEGNPAGGHSAATGITVDWQNGPLGRGAERKEPNGAFVETLIAIAADRIAFYQSGKFASEDNAAALSALHDALRFLNRRTAAREARGVEGTHQE